MSTVKELISSLLADNTTGEITAEDLRNVLNAMVDDYSSAGGSAGGGSSTAPVVKIVSSADVVLNGRSYKTGINTFDSLVTLQHNTASIDIERVDVFGNVKISDGYRFFSYNRALREINILPAPDLSECGSMREMFRDCRNLVELDVSLWDTSNVADMKDCFNHCDSLELIDVSNWDVSRVSNFRGMFSGCVGLKSLDLRKWQTTSATDMASMFASCNSLTSIRFGSGFFTNNLSDINISHLNNWTNVEEITEMINALPQTSTPRNLWLSYATNQVAISAGLIDLANAKGWSVL